MAEVDFSHARIQPWSNNSKNPTTSASVSLGGMTDLYNSSIQSISSTITRTNLVDQQKQLVYQYSGSFTASGIEFYLVAYDGSSYNGWKISNISFNSGDTFIFQIQADLICQ